MFRTGHLGDTIAALPAFWRIRDHFPNAEIALLTNTSAKPGDVPAGAVLPQKGLFDRYIGYGASLGTFRGLAGFAGLMADLRSRRFEALVYLMTRNRTERQIRRDLRFFRACGIRGVFGARHLLENLVSGKQEKPLQSLSKESDFLIECLESEGISGGSSAVLRDSLFGFSSDERAEASDWLEKRCAGGSPVDLLIAVAPGSKWSSKVWPEERFREAVGRLVEERSVFPVVFGGPEDREKGSRLINSWGRGANAAGDLDVRAAAAVISSCRLYIGNDTGTMHMAAAVGVPCVGVFAAIDNPGRWEPMGHGHSVLRVSVECEGCLTPDCFNDLLCLRSISADDVYRASIDLIDRD